MMRELVSLDLLLARLLDTPYDHSVLLDLHRALGSDPLAYATVLERAADQCGDDVLAAHWLTEAANALNDADGKAERAVELLARALRLDPGNPRIAADLDAAAARAEVDRATDPDGIAQRFADELRQGIGSDVLDYLEAVADHVDDGGEGLPHAMLVEALEARAGELRESLHARASLLRRAAAIAFRELGDVDAAYDYFVEAVLSTIEGDARSAADRLVRERRSAAQRDTIRALPSIRVGHGSFDTVPAPPPTAPPRSDADTVAAPPLAHSQPLILLEQSEPVADEPPQAAPTPFIDASPADDQHDGHDECPPTARSDAPPLVPESSIVLRDSIFDDIPAPPTIPSAPGTPADEPLVDRLFETLHCVRFIESADEAAASALEAAVRLIGATKGIVHRYDFAAREFVVVRAYGPRAGSITRLRTDERDELIQQVMTADEAIFVPASADDTSISRGRWAYLEPKSCLLCAAARIDGRYVGMIEIADPIGRPIFTEEERLALTYVGTVLAELIAERVSDPDEEEREISA